MTAIRRTAQAVALIGLAALQGVGTPAAADTGVVAGSETAALPSGLEVEASGLPTILFWSDARIYRKIFALQQRGEMASADKLIPRIENGLLMGHVLAQRYLHPTAYRSSYEELRDWLVDYADHPEAYAIYRLATKRKPEGAEDPPEAAPSKASLTSPATRSMPIYRSPRQLSEEVLTRVTKIKAQIRKSVGERNFATAKAYLEKPEVRELLDPVEIDQGYAKLATGLLHAGRDARAHDLARKVIARSGEFVPIAHWTAGLSAWRLGDYERAAGHFEAFGGSERVSSWNAAAGAFWAARAHTRTGDRVKAFALLMAATEYPHTFYGLLARAMLAIDMPFDFRSHRLTPAGVEILLRTPEGKRAFALMQIGQRERAGLELLRMGGWAERRVADALLAVGEWAKLPTLSFRLAHRLVNVERLRITDGLDRALYPLPPWQPKAGFKVDRALVYALMRKESSFDSRATSVDGAQGLMQLMPATASYVAGQDFSGKDKAKLWDPEVNIDIGQRYIGKLLGNKRIAGDLFRLAAAYNGGPGNLAKWQKEIGAEDDPLLFIESLPSLETRLFIEQVLTNLWIYRTRLGQPTPSLDAIAAGRWPTYEALDGAEGKLVQNGTD